MHLRQRGKKWYAVVYVGERPGRSSPYSWVPLSSDYEEAVRMAKNLDRQDQITFGEYLRLWLDEWEGSPTTLASYREECERHIIPELGHIRLSLLKPSDLKAFYAKKRKEVSPKTGRPLSGTTVNYFHRIIRAALSYAVNDDRFPIQTNPAKAVPAPRKSEYEAPLWSEEESQRFLQVIRNHRDFALYATAVLTGMRRGEVCGLHLQNLLLDQHFIRVRHNLVYVNNKPLLRDKPKRSSSRRDIALGPRLVAILAEHLQRLEERRKTPSWQEHGLVFPNRYGGYIDPHNLSARQFPALCEKAGVRRIPFHSLRHTNLTVLLENGVDDTVAQRRGGHSSVQVLRDNYGHARLGPQRQAAVIAEECLLGGDAV